MKTNENNLNIIDEELDELSKKVYLESPDFWISISDKIIDRTFDEMLLFFAVKYNYYNILFFALENDYIDLNMPSKNKNYTNIMNHLLDTAKQNEDKKIYNYLINLNKPNNLEKNSLSNTINCNCSEKPTEKKAIYLPKFLCPHCDYNIFDTGYKVSNDIVYKFSTDKFELVEISSKIATIKCCNCDGLIEDITPEKLYRICKIQNCNSCGSVLTKVGITSKGKMEFDDRYGNFNSKSVTYCCSNCDFEIDSVQREYFKL